MDKEFECIIDEEDEDEVTKEFCAMLKMNMESRFPGTSNII
jgi:hypothetical protein